MASLLSYIGVEDTAVMLSRARLKYKSKSILAWDSDSKHSITSEQTRFGTNASSDYTAGNVFVLKSLGQVDEVT